MSEEKITEDRVVGEMAEILEGAIHSAPKKDVGFFLKAVSIAIVIFSIGYAISMIFEGNREFSYEREDGSSIKIKKEDSSSFIELIK